MNKKVTVIIVNWNGERFLADCLKAVKKQSYDNYDVIVVDNGSIDKSREIVGKFEGIKLIALDKNFGFAEANNFGIKEAFKDLKVRYVAFLNNDTIVEDEWLKQLVLSIDNKPMFEMASSMCIFPTGKIQALGLKYERNLIGEGKGGLALGYGEDPKKYLENQEIFVPNGAACIYTRDLLEKIGLFDKDFFAYAEDLDLGMRARSLGYRCMLAANSRLIHLHSQTAGAASPLKAFLTKRNSYFVVLKNYSFSDMVRFPFWEIGWNLKSLFEKNEDKSVNKLKEKVGLTGLFFIMAKTYLNVLLFTPKMLFKRFKKQKY